MTRVFEINPFSTLPLYCVILLITILLLWLCIFSPFSKKVKFLKVWAGILVICSILGMGVYATDIVSVYYPYKDGNFETVSGRVENYLKRPDTAQPKYVEFTVSDVAFSYGTEDGTIGHPTNDVLRGDGQKVTIGYVRRNSQKLCIVFIDTWEE